MILGARIAGPGLGPVFTGRISDWPVHRALLAARTIRRDLGEPDPIHTMKEANA